MAGIESKVVEYNKLRNRLVNLENVLDERIAAMKSVIADFEVRHTVRKGHHKKKFVLGARKWTELDISQLVHLLRQKPQPLVKDMAKALHRTPHAVWCRVYILKHSGLDVKLVGRKARKRTGKNGKRNHKPHHKWTDAEKHKALELSAKGVKSVQIAKEFGLRENQVSDMIWHLKRNGGK